MTLLWCPLLSATVPIDPATGDFDWSVIPFPVYGSPKVDGFRGMIQRATLVSRNGLPVKNRELQARFGKSEYEGLDLELTDGPANAPDVFHRTSCIVKKAAASAKDTTANVIDWFGDLAISERFSMLHEAHGWRPRSEKLAFIEQVPIENVAQLKKYEKSLLAKGWEGVMLRKMDQGQYPQKTDKHGKLLKSNRSTLNEFYLARLKRFETDEAVIVAFHPLEHNTNEERTATGARSSKKAGIVVDHDRVGSVTLKDVKTGKEFDTTVGSTRLREWKGWAGVVGKTVRYRYQLIGTKDLPRLNTCSFQELLP